MKKITRTFLTIAILSAALIITSITSAMASSPYTDSEGCPLPGWAIKEILELEAMNGIGSNTSPLPAQDVASIPTSDGRKLKAQLEYQATVNVGTEFMAEVGNNQSAGLSTSEIIVDGRAIKEKLERDALIHVGRSFNRIVDAHTPFKFAPLVIKANDKIMNK